MTITFHPVLVLYWQAMNKWIEALEWDQHLPQSLAISSDWSHDQFPHMIAEHTHTTSTVQEYLFMALQVRFAVLKVLQELYTRLGEEFMVLLPETIPFLAELMEGTPTGLLWHYVYIKQYSFIHTICTYTHRWIYWSGTTNSRID